MSKVTYVLAFFAALTVVHASNAQAQAACSLTELNALASCADAGATSCGAGYPDCIRTRAAITLDDVEDFARDRCCSLNDSSDRASCLALYKFAYALTPSGPQKPFMRAARRRIQQLRSSDCGTVGYAALF